MLVEIVKSRGWKIFKGKYLNTVNYYFVALINSWHDVVESLRRNSTWIWHSFKQMLISLFIWWYGNQVLPNVRKQKRGTSWQFKQLVDLNFRCCSPQSVKHRDAVQSSVMSKGEEIIGNWGKECLRVRVKFEFNSSVSTYYSYICLCGLLRSAMKWKFNNDKV